MATCSEESLDKLLKKDIKNIVLSLQNEMQSNTKILEKLRELDIEASHRVGKYNKVIIKFSKLMDYRQIFSINKDLS